MVVYYDEDNFSIKLYRDCVKGELVGLTEVIPIDELLEVWQKHKADTPQMDCKKCKHFATDKCHECYGNEYFEDSGYTTEMANISQTLDLGNGFSITANVADTPQTDCDHKCIQTEVGCERTDCPWK